MNYSPVFTWAYMYFFVICDNEMMTYIDTNKLLNLIQQHGKYTKDSYFHNTLKEEVLYMHQKIGNLFVITEDQYNIIFSD